jgi:hypothetical protein
MGATVLLLSEATVLAIVALAAIVVVALVVLAVVVLAGPQAHRPVAVGTAPSIHVREPVPRSLASVPVRAGSRSLEIDVPTQHVDEFMSALRSAGWNVHETGDVVATDEDEEGLTTILVDLPKMSRSQHAGGEEIR